MFCWFASFQKKEQGPAVGPVVLGILLFVVVGSGVFSSLCKWCGVYTKIFFFQLCYKLLEEFRHSKGSTVTLFLSPTNFRLKHVTSSRSIRITTRINKFSKAVFIIDKESVVQSVRIHNTHNLSFLGSFLLVLLGGLGLLCLLFFLFNLLGNCCLLCSSFSQVTILGTTSFSLFSQLLLALFLGFGLEDVLLQNTLVSENVTLGLLIQLLVSGNERRVNTRLTTSCGFLSSFMNVNTYKCRSIFFASRYLRKSRRRTLCLRIHKIFSGSLAFLVPFLLPGPVCLPFLLAMRWALTRAREWTTAGFLKMKPSLISLRTFWPVNVLAPPVQWRRKTTYENWP